MRIFTDLKLDGASSTRARPNVGEWGPHLVPTTRRKRWQRIYVPLAFLLAATALIVLGYVFYIALTG